MLILPILSPLLLGYGAIIHSNQGIEFNDGAPQVTTSKLYRSGTELKWDGGFNSGADSSIHGVTVGRGAGSVVSNVAVGTGVLPDNTVGSGNAVFGSSGGGITTGSGNTILGNGANALAADLTNNILLVAGNVVRMQFNGTDWSIPAGNFTFPKKVVLADTTADDLGVIYKGSTAFLHNFHHPTGNTTPPEGKNLFLGLGAGNFTTGSTASSAAHGSSNIAIGDGSAAALTIGYQNTIVGVATAANITTVHENVIIGGNACAALTSSGSYAVSIGNFSLYAKSAGDYDVAIGYMAGRYYGAGTSTNTGSSNSIFIGARTRAYAAANETNQIVIGDQAIGNGSNTITLGNASATQIYTAAIISTTNSTLSTTTTTGAIVAPSLGISGQATIQTLQIEGVSTLKGRVVVNVATASASYGTVSIGGGPFDGSSTGKFAGSASGTSLAINELTGFSGYLLEAQINGTYKFKVDSSGGVYAAGNIYMNNNRHIYVGLGNVSTDILDILPNGNQFTNTTGSYSYFGIKPSYNQASGDASNTDLLINRTENAVGSGAQYLFQAQVGGVSKFSISNTGVVVAATSLIVPTIYGSPTTAGELVLRGNSADTTTGAVSITTTTAANIATGAGALKVGGGINCNGTSVSSGAWSSYRDTSTSTLDGFLAQTTNSATVGTPVRVSPRIRISSKVYNTTSSANNICSFAAYVTPVSGAVPTYSLDIYKSNETVDGSVFTKVWSLSDSGVMTVATISGNDLTANDLNLRANSADLTTGRVHVLTTLDATTGATASLMTDGGIYAAKSIIASGMLQINRVMSGAVRLNGVVISPSGAATAGVPVRWSPLTGIYATVWDTTNVVSKQSSFEWINKPTSGATPTSLLTLSHGWDGAAPEAHLITISDTGVVNILNNTASTNSSTGSLIVTGGIGGNHAAFNYLILNAQGAGNIVDFQYGGVSKVSINADGTLTTSGHRIKVAGKTSDYAILVSDYLLRYTGTGGHTFTLPAATGTGQVYVIKHDGSGLLAVARSGSDTIDGASSIVLQNPQSVFVCDTAASTWSII